MNLNGKKMQSFMRRCMPLPSQKSKPKFNQEKARFSRDEYNFNGINRDISEFYLSEILS